MEQTEVIDAPRVRWGRALLAAFLAEVALALIAAPVLAAMGTDGAANDTLNLLVPLASFVLFIAAGWWAARGLARQAIPTGVVTGVWAVVIYIALGLIASQFVEGSSVTDGFTGPYLVAHLLKIAGGALGGLIAARRNAGMPG